jgi:hypothetical protein
MADAPPAGHRLLERKYLGNHLGRLGRRSPVDALDLLIEGQAPTGGLAAETRATIPNREASLLQDLTAQSLGDAFTELQHTAGCLSLPIVGSLSEQDLALIVDDNAGNTHRVASTPKEDQPETP